MRRHGVCVPCDARVSWWRPSLQYGGKGAIDPNMSSHTSQSSSGSPGAATPGSSNSPSPASRGWVLVLSAVLSHEGGVRLFHLLIASFQLPPNADTASKPSGPLGASLSLPSSHNAAPLSMIVERSAASASGGAQRPNTSAGASTT